MKDTKKDAILSIIIPHYNNAVLLNKLLLSIPDRDWIQVIVVDDHSDKLLSEYEELKRKFAEERGYLFLENSDKYAGTARNYGMKFAIGKWLMFADSDDFFTENFEEIISKHLDDTEDLICFTPTSVDIDDPEKKSYRHTDMQRLVEDYVMSPSKSHEYALRFRYGVPWSKMIKRDLVISNGILYEASKQAEDLLFSVKCGGYAGKIKAVDEVIYCVTRRKGSLSRITKSKEDQERIEDEHDKMLWWIARRVGLKGAKALGWSRVGYWNIILKHYKRQIKKSLRKSK